MARERMAPVLRRFVAERSCGQRECAGKSKCHEAEAQLAALLAVARAAELISHMDWCPASGMDAPETPCTCPHKRALARLARASGKRR